MLKLWYGAWLNFYSLFMMLFSLFFAIPFDFVSLYSTKSQKKKIFFISFFVSVPRHLHSVFVWILCACYAVNECSSISILVVIIYSCSVPFAGKRSCNYFPIRITRSIEQNKRSIEWIEWKSSITIPIDKEINNNFQAFSPFFLLPIFIQFHHIY